MFPERSHMFLVTPQSISDKNIFQRQTMVLGFVLAPMSARGRRNIFSQIGRECSPNVPHMFLAHSAVDIGEKYFQRQTKVLASLKVPQSDVD